MNAFTYGYSNDDVNFDVMKSVVIRSIDGMEKGSEEIIFNTECGRQFKMFHMQYCGENVYLDDICGDPDDLIGCEILHFEERTNRGDEDSEDKPSCYSGSFTWTFYDIQTSKGSVNLKWLGESNGYYSEDVWFLEGKKVAN